MNSSYRDPKRGLLITLCVLLSILLVLVIGLAVLVTLWDSYKNKINFVEHIGVKETELYAQMKAEGLLIEDDDEIINILLIGQDAREGESRQRSDSMILCTVNLHNNTLTMTSFMRDMYVDIPGKDANRINAAYQMGGMELLDLTLLQNFGVVVDYNIEIDFQGFMKAVDIVGGVDIELSQSEANYLNRRGNWDVDNSTAGTWELRAGVNHLTGEQALAYCRIREVGNSDFGRTDRQRLVLNTVMDECKALSARQLDRLLKEILPLITTDMNSKQIDNYMVQLLPLLPKLDVSQLRMPADGAYRDEIVAGMQVLVPDFAANKALLREVMLG